MNPALISRAARLQVTPCHINGLYHVNGGREPHIVKRSTNDASLFFCDCTARKFGNTCSHILSVHFFNEKKSNNG